MLLVGLGLAARHVLWRTDTDHHGGVLTVIVANEFWFPAGFNAFDPAIQNSEWHSRLAAMTNNGLVGFRRAEGSHGAEIVPDLATTMPTRTNGGLTYTFHLRKGLRYSTGAPVLAGDIRRGIERTIVHPDTTYSAVYYWSAIVGARACLNVFEEQDWTTHPRPDCDLREGISTDDRTGTVSFHLTKPAPDFLNELALPGAVAVPQDTPVDLPAGTILPATGPYQIRPQTPMSDPASGHPRLELVRNPRFRVWSSAAQPDGYPDRVVLETGYTNNEAVARVSRRTRRPALVRCNADRPGQAPDPARLAAAHHSQTRDQHAVPQHQDTTVRQPRRPPRSRLRA